MRLARPSTDPDAFPERLTQVCPLRIEASSRFLEVRKSRPILQVKEGGSVELPGDHVSTARELVMLVGLIDAHSIAKLPEMRCLELAHETRPRARQATASTTAAAGVRP